MKLTHIKQKVEWLRTLGVQTFLNMLVSQKVITKQAEKLKGATIMNTSWNHTENATNRNKKDQSYG
jgi:hypothetical protein